MPGNDDKKKVLYDAVSRDYDIGTYDEFTTKLNDPAKRKAFYEGVGSEYELGDYDTFSKKIGFDSQETKKQSLPFLQTPDQQLNQVTSNVVPQSATPQQPKADNQNDQFLNIGEPVKSAPNKLAVAVNKDKKKEGSVLGGVYNTLVGSIARAAGGTMELGADLTKAAVTPFVKGSGKDGEFTESDKAARNAIISKVGGSREDVTNLIEKARSSSSTKEQEDIRKDFDVTNGVTADDVEAMMFQAPSQLADMALGALSAGSSFFVQSVNDNAEELDKNQNAANLTDNEKLGYLLTQATVQAALEKLSLNAIFKSTGLGKGVQQKISKEIIDEFVEKGKKATAQEIEELAIKKASQFVSKAKRVGVGTAMGALAEGGTEGVQSVASDAIKIATNKISGKDVFDEEDIKKNFIKNAINSTVLGGAFGGVFGGLSGAVNNTNKAIREQVSQAQTPEDLQAIQQQINEQVEAGNITEEEANNANIKAQQYVDIASKIPSNIDADTKYKIIGGIEQRNDLETEIQKVQTEIESLDPAFQKDKKNQVELLQAKLGEVNDYLEGIVEGGAPTYEEKNGKYIKISVSGEETEIPKQQYEFGKAIQENEKIKQTEPQEVTGDIATEPVNTIEDGEGQRGEERGQELLTTSENISKVEGTGEQPVSSIENEKAAIKKEWEEELSKTDFVGETIKWNGEYRKVKKSTTEDISFEDGTGISMYDFKSARDYQINEKYEAELKALENETKAQTEKPIIKAIEGDRTGNEPITAEKSSNTETIIPETTQDTGTQPPIPTEPSEGGIEPPSVPPPEPPSNIPTSNEFQQDQRRFTQQMMRTDDLAPEVKSEVAKTLDYVVQTNEMSMAEANQILSSMNEDAAMNMVFTGEGIKPAVRVVLAQALIKKFNDLGASAQDEQTKNYYYDKAIQTATFVTQKLATEPGQMIQAFSLWSRLSPEAQLRAAVKDAEIQGKDRKRRTKKDVDKLGDKLNAANEQAAKEVTEDKDVKDTVEKTDNEKIKRAKSKIARAKTKRQNLIKKYKGSKGSSLFSTVPGLSTEGIEFVGEVALTYIEEGVANLEILVQKVKEALKDASGKDVPEELNEQITTIADDRLNRADMRLIGEQLKSQKMKINDIIQQHYTVQDAAKKSLADKLIEEAGLEGAEAKELADKVSAAFDRIATRRKKQILFQEKARFDRIKKGLKGANTVDPKTLQGEMIRYSNLGAFNNDEFAEMIAEKLGTGKVAPEQAAKISELAEKVEKAPEGSPKNDATEDLLAYRAEMKGHNWAEIAQGVWYANVLSGYKTHEKNIVSTFFNGVGELSAQIAKNPKEAPYILYGLLKGLRRGALEATHTITTGRSPIHVKKIETPNVLERKDFVGGNFNPANWLKFVTRLMVGEDVLQFQGLKEARAYQLASREAHKELGTRNPFKKEVWDKVDELLLNTKDRYDEALSQAKGEGLKSSIDIKRRVYELMESSRPVPMTEDAYGFAAHGTFNHEVEGTLGALTNALSQLVDTPIAGFQPLRFVVPFTRIISNVVNTGLNYTPVGYLRAARGVRGFKSFEDYAIAKKAYVKLTNEQRQELVAKASLGIGITLGLYMLSQIKGDDDEPIIEITGGGTGDYKKDQQLRDNGWQEYSIKIGGTYYSYKLTPLVFMLGFLGNMNDKQKYAPNEDEATTLKQIELASYRTGHLISDMTWINSGGTLLGALAQPNPSGGNEIGNALEQSAKGFIIPQAYTQAAQEVESIMRLPQKQVNNMWENMIQDVPIARNKLNDKINALGEPIIRDVDVITSSETTNPVWKFLLDKGGWVAPVNKKSMIVWDGKGEREATDEEYYNFSKLRGQKIKSAILELMNRGIDKETKTDEDLNEETKTAKDMSKDELQIILKKIATKATNEAKEELFNPNEVGRPQVTIEISE